jgi:cold shock CspA family protein
VTRGVVTLFDPNRAFGFITPDGAPPTARGIFLHVRELVDPSARERLAPGVGVIFDVRRTLKGREAINVSLEEQSQ